MALPKPNRKKRFRMALAACEMTQGAWAAAQGITPAYLSNVLAGRLNSKTLWERIEAFSDEQLKKAKLVA